ncbi:MAG: phosphoribosyltransferase family protein [Acidobacteriota bacterium]
MSWRRECRESWRALLALVFPGPCPLCERDLPGQAIAGICPGCWGELAPHCGPSCRVCDLPLPRVVGPAHCPDCQRDLAGARGLHTVAATRYQGHSITLHRRFKFDEALDLAEPLAARMAIAWRWRGRFRPDLIVPVPPDPWRWGPRRRAPRRLAHAVARRLGVPCSTALRKRRSVRPQTGRDAQARVQALRGVFAAEPQSVAGRSILLIDDVATTGATLRSAAAALRSAGAKRVGVLVFARTPLPSGDHRPL